MSPFQINCVFVKYDFKSFERTQTQSSNNEKEDKENQNYCAASCPNRKNCRLHARPEKTEKKVLNAINLRNNYNQTALDKIIYDQDNRKRNRCNNEGISAKSADEKSGLNEITRPNSVK